MDMNTVINCKDQFTVVDIKECGGSYTLSLSGNDALVSLLLTYEQVEYISDKARDEIGELNFRELEEKIYKLENHIEELETNLEIEHQKVEHYKGSAPF